MAKKDNLTRFKNQKPMRNNIQIAVILLVIASIVAFAVMMSTKI